MLRSETEGHSSADSVPPKRSSANSDPSGQAPADSVTSGQSSASSVPSGHSSERTSVSTSLAALSIAATALRKQGLTSFSGTDDGSFHDWYDRFLLFSSEYEWSDRDKAIVIGRFLRIDAFEQWKLMPEDQQAELKAVVPYLKARFPKVRMQVETALAEFEGISQEKDEELSSLAARIERLVSIAYEDTNDKGRDRVKQRQFLRALSCRETRRAMSVTTKASFHELVQESRRFQTVIANDPRPDSGRTPQSRTEYVRAATDSNFDPDPPPRTGSGQRKQGPIAHRNDHESTRNDPLQTVLSRLNQFADSLTRSIPQAPSSHSGSSGHRPFPRLPAQSDSRLCYNCNEYGHISTVCPQPPTARTVRKRAELEAGTRDSLPNPPASPNDPNPTTPARGQAASTPSA